MMTRRDALKLAALATVTVATSARAGEVSIQPKEGLAGKEPAPPASGYVLPPLPYAYDALEPHIDAQTMEIHHKRHHSAYVGNLNAAIKAHPEVGTKPIEEVIGRLDRVPEDIRLKVRNFGGGHANHAFFWKVLVKTEQRQPKRELHVALMKEFNTFDAFKSAFVESASGLFGSGWTWLTIDERKRLRIENTANQDSPLMAGRTPLLTLDLWEHAYYLKHQNKRADYIRAFFNVINWDFVTEEFLKASKA